MSVPSAAPITTYRFAHFIQTYQSSPIGLSGRPAHCPFRGLLGVHSRCGLHTRAVTNSRHANRRLQPLRYLHDCSECFRLERLPGGACTHWKAPPLHGAHPKRTSVPFGENFSRKGLVPCQSTPLNLQTVTLGRGSPPHF